MADEFVVVLTTCPDRSAADRLSTALLEQRLAACVNQIAGVRSQYLWDGRIRQDDEVLLVIKTTRNASVEAEALIGKLHPYDVPEIINLPIVSGAANYLQWIAESTER